MNISRPTHKKPSPTKETFVYPDSPEAWSSTYSQTSAKAHNPRNGLKPLVRRSKCSWVFTISISKDIPIATLSSSAADDGVATAICVCSVSRYILLERPIDSQQWKQICRTSELEAAFPRPSRTTARWDEIIKVGMIKQGLHKADIKAPYSTSQRDSTYQ